MLDTLDIARSTQAVAFVQATYLGLLAAGMGVDIALATRLRRETIKWPLVEERLARRAVPANDCALVASLWVLLFLVAQALPGLIGMGDGGGPAAAGWPFALQLLTQLVMILTALIVLRVRMGAYRHGLGGSRRGVAADLKRAFVFYLAAMPVFCAGALLWNLFLNALGLAAQPQPPIQVFVQLDLSWQQAAFIAIAAVSGPIQEELIFRGVALPVFARRLGAWHGMAALSLIFAVMHSHLPSLLPLFLISMAFSIGYLLSGSILVPIAMHAYFNGINLLCLAVVRLLN